MPVVISLLNSFTGLGAALAGLIYGNQVMLVGGVLVGASGTILTILMCQAMNRSLLNVIIGGFTASGGAAVQSGDQVAKEATFVDTAIMLKYAQKVIVVPGYGMAVAQAQHTVHDLEKSVEDEGVSFKYAIHPVAGRMPGHMNVLLAEADVPYPKLLDLDDANREFASTDVVLVIGANDVVNPAAKTDTSSPIYGMPILDVELAKNVIVLKRSMNPGYAGIQNQLFFGEKTRMLFGDAKSSLSKLIEELGSV
jgi:NAD(P) transhydrogenase subunit beta